SDILELNGKVHGINIKLSKCGSILDSIRIIQYAKQVGMKILLGCMVESSIGITAAYHLSSLADYVDLDGNILIDNDPYEGVNTENGILTLNDRTGLGVTKR
ncbi:MAG: dipeptide epimerase, partial [candidate division Zixibacteria bacterium]|nr:dipeptide epimerase [candidate division Zixibacteria bacterium]